MITDTITGVSVMEAGLGLQQGGEVKPDPEVPEKPTRRRFTAEYKLRILHLADACTEPGSVGALLRREGSSLGKGSCPACGGEETSFPSPRVEHGREASSG